MLIIDDLNAVTLEASQLLNFTNARMQVVRETCKNCKFWDKKGYEQSLHGYCEKLDRTDVDTNGAYSSDGIETGPDFGCIHFEPKEQNG